MIKVSEQMSFNVNEISSTIHTHFKSKGENASMQVKRILKLGWRSLLVGFAFLIIMYLLTKVLTGLLHENTLMITLRELFIILAWVALWRPADLLLYDWQLHKRNAKLFYKIAKSKVQVLSA
jgi:hypothetical protein